MQQDGPENPLEDLDEEELLRELKANNPEELAEEHWDWVEPLLELCFLDAKEIQRLEYLYRTAFEHGYKHGEETKV